ncbi:MAG: fumarylacetoacetate hydrolase family protein [Nocardioides sp.]|uniref:2-keto-4-pentenoate hydratase n=1 Tax=Nocardioides sp. TaxID=35761 RepID=UPI0039E2D89B
MSAPAVPSTSAAVQRLDRAAVEIRPCAPVRDLIGDSDLAVAYAVQAELTDLRVARGGRIVGRKIGLTSPAVQKQLGVDQPDFGVLFADMEYRSGSTISTSTLLQPKVEAEVAFGLRNGLDVDLRSLDAYARVRNAVAYAVAALEIVDSRIDDWDITITDTIADNGSSGLFVVGNDHVTLDHIKPRDVTMTMRVNNEVASTGDGSACLGDPLLALLWLARKAQEVGNPLRAGDLVLSGALGPMASVYPGDVVSADISGLGTVTATFSEAGQ